MYCYFIQGVNGGPVKIGKADLPQRRLAQLQPANPTELCIRAVCRGGNIAERELHARFADTRIGKSEWFDISDDLEQLMASLPTWQAVQEGADCPELGAGNMRALLALYDSGYSLYDISDMLGHTRQRSHQILTEARVALGLKHPKKGQSRPPRPEEPIEQAYARISTFVSAE